MSTSRKPEHMVVLYWLYTAQISLHACDLGDLFAPIPLSFMMAISIANTGGLYPSNKAMISAVITLC